MSRDKKRAKVKTIIASLIVNCFIFSTATQNSYTELGRFARNAFERIIWNVVTRQLIRQMASTKSSIMNTNQESGHKKKH